MNISSLLLSKTFLVNDAKLQFLNNLTSVLEQFELTFKCGSNLHATSYKMFNLGLDSRSIFTIYTMYEYLKRDRKYTAMWLLFFAFI